MQEMPYDAFIELVRNRRSVRNVKRDPIPDEFVTKIQQPAGHHPYLLSAPVRARALADRGVSR